MTPAYLLVCVCTFLINVPAGYWREGVKKFSVSWFIAVHAAVPLVIMMRVYAGIEWRVPVIAGLVACYFLGQFAGSRLRRRYLHRQAQEHPGAE